MRFAHLSDMPTFTFNRANSQSSALSYVSGGLGTDLDS